MPLLRSCCLCVAPQTAAFIMGAVGMLVSCVLVAPLAVFLDHQTFYITQFARSQRERGNYMDDDEVPEVVVFSRVLYSVLLSMAVLYIFSCIFLLVGIVAKKHLLLIPWLVYMFIIMLVIVTIVISFIIGTAGLQDYVSLAVFLGSSPVLLSLVYVWLVAVSAYQIIRSESGRARGPTSSPSVSSLVSIKEGIQRVLGGTPPPPYEAVTTEAGSPRKRRESNRFSRQISPESSTSQTLFFDISSTRRSSDETPSTKPASPTPFHIETEKDPFRAEKEEEKVPLQKDKDSNTSLAHVEHHQQSPQQKQHQQQLQQDIEALFSGSVCRLAESVSTTNLCDRHTSPVTIKKSSSSFMKTTRFLDSQEGTQDTPSQEEMKGKEGDLMTTWSSMSDETSSLSTTSLEAKNPNNILV